jgi:putative copper resistance protein D
MGLASWRALFVTVDGLHTVAAGSWIGSLGVILAVGRRVEGAPANELFAAQIRSFSPMALVSVSVLLSMGIVLAWTHLSEVSDLWTLGYGRVLSAKVGMAGAVFVAGFLNWRRGVPALDTAAAVEATQRRAAWEVALAVGVLLLTAVLVHSVLP